MTGDSFIVELGDSATRVLLAVVDQQHPTVRSVAGAVDLSVTNTYRHLGVLRRRGLVTWADGKAGTLRPLVKRVKVPA